MLFALMTEPQQGLSYEEILAVCRAAEEAGFETYLRSDHYTSFPGEEGLHTTDAWATLAGLARETSRIRLGTLVSPVTFRIPGALAKLVGTVDEMSGGRIDVGLGAGWNAREHAQLGIPFPPLGERYDRLEEALTILHGLWTEPDGWSFEGRHWQVRGARLRPRAADAEGHVPPGRRRHPRLVLGGEGKPRGLGLAARFADEYNLVSARPERARAVYAELDAACERLGRDPAEVIHSAMTGVLVAEDESALKERVRAQLEMFGDDPGGAEDWLAERRKRWIMGTPEQALERIAEFERAGVQRLALQDFVPRDLDMVRFMGERLLPQAA
jgi:F420-dependent oxidoreductase-like protein